MANGNLDLTEKSHSLIGVLEDVSSVHYVIERGPGYFGSILINPSEAFATRVKIRGDDGRLYEGTIWNVACDNHVGKRVVLNESPDTLEFLNADEKFPSGPRQVHLVQRLCYEGQQKPIFEAIVDLLRINK